MAFKMTLWVCVLMFAATIYNVVGAYGAMGDMNVHSKFQEIGLLDKPLTLPAHKPALNSQMASN